MILTTNKYHATLRSYLAPFIERSFLELNPDREFLPNWHIELIANVLEDCMRGKTTRLIICVPPRALKSHCVSVAFVTWLLGHHPSAQILCASYGQNLADKHALDTRNLMLSPIYQSLFSTRISPEKYGLSEIGTTARGFRLALSKGGAVTGRGADYLILDDLLKPEEALSDVQRKSTNDWYDHTLYSRLNDKRTGRIILIMQRLHEDDLVGHLLKREGFKVLQLPAIAEQEERHRIRMPFGRYREIVRRPGEALHPERESLQELKEIRENLGEYFWAAQYQQTPAPLEGGIVKTAWFKAYTPTDRPESFELIFDSWDTANKPTELSDYSVCTTWGLKEKRLYLLDVQRKRLDYPDLKRLVLSHAQLFQAQTVLIEDKASGIQLIQELKDLGFYGAKAYSTNMDKVMRLRSVTGIIESGFVYLPDSVHWLPEYLHELATFPNGRHDDQVDSTSQALDWVRGRSRFSYGLLEYAKAVSSVVAPDPQYSRLFMRPCGAAR